MPIPIMDRLGIQQFGGGGTGGPSMVPNQPLPGVGALQPPPVNVGVKFPVPPAVLPPHFMNEMLPASSGFGLNNLARFHNIGPGLAQAQSPPTTYGFSSGNPGQLPSQAASVHPLAGPSLLHSLAGGMSMSPNGGF